MSKRPARITSIQWVVIVPSESGWVAADNHPLLCEEEAKDQLRYIRASGSPTFADARLVKGTLSFTPPTPET